jgi:radical SAM-linked protein
VRASQGTPHRYRLRYTKLGRIAFLGHLDLIRHLPRIFRRAGLDLFYTLGFHPKPELSFGPALGLGIPSLGEILDVTLVDDVDPADLLRALSRVTLEGIEVLDAARLGDNDRALGRVIVEAEFAARLPAGTDVAAACARFAGDEPLIIRRESEKGIARTIEVRRSLRSLSPFESAEARRRLEWADGPMAAFRIGVSHEGSARPSEVVAALWGTEIAAETDLARLALHAEQGLDPLRPAELRRGPQPEHRSESVPSAAAP